MRFGALCFCVLDSPAGRVFCVFVFWPRPQGSMRDATMPWASIQGKKMSKMCYNSIRIFVFLCFGLARLGDVFCVFVFGAPAG